MRIFVLVVLCLLIGGCGNPTPLGPEAYRVEPDAQSMKVNTGMNFTAVGASGTPNWRFTVGGAPAVLAGYIKEPAATGPILRVNAVKATTPGFPLIVCAVLNGDWKCSLPVSIVP